MVHLALIQASRFKLKQRSIVKESEKFDVVIAGAGLSGLSLARHLLLTTKLSVCLLEKKENVPGSKQKVGESLVQVGGYYFSKCLDLEQHLLRDHFMKYNLRFYFKNSSENAEKFEGFSQAYIRNFSNIPCYQMDRLAVERELLRLNNEFKRFTLKTNVRHLHPQLATHNGCHSIGFSQLGQPESLEGKWFVDSTGRGRLLQRHLSLKQPSPIDHGAAFMWVDGLVDIEKLTSANLREQRMNPNKRETGHLPHWLATNHFMDEGLWLWTIPLRDKTSIGLVYDRKIVDLRDVNSSEKLTNWISKKFPLFAETLANREVVDFGAYKSFAYGATETINADRWAITGEASRFTDPLYSPGSDFISLHNTMIVDAIQSDLEGRLGHRELKRKCWLYELVMQAYYKSLLPSFSTSYDALGDHECFSLKYTWELSVYFSYFVFPFINDLHVNSEFLPNLLSKFSKLGPMNSGIQRFLSGYFQWKKSQQKINLQQMFHDFSSLATLQRAEETFYEVGAVSYTHLTLPTILRV